MENNLQDQLNKLKEEQAKKGAGISMLAGKLGMNFDATTGDLTENKAEPAPTVVEPENENPTEPVIPREPRWKTETEKNTEGLRLMQALNDARAIAAEEKKNRTFAEKAKSLIGKQPQNQTYMQARQAYWEFLYDAKRDEFEKAGIGADQEELDYQLHIYTTEELYKEIENENANLVALESPAKNNFVKKAWKWYTSDDKGMLDRGEITRMQWFGRKLGKIGVTTAISTAVLAGTASVGIGAGVGGVGAVGWRVGRSAITAFALSPVTKKIVGGISKGIDKGFDRMGFDEGVSKRGIFNNEIVEKGIEGKVDEIEKSFRRTKSAEKWLKTTKMATKLIVMGGAAFAVSAVTQTELKAMGVGSANEVAAAQHFNESLGMTGGHPIPKGFNTSDTVDYRKLQGVIDTTKVSPDTTKINLAPADTIRADSTNVSLSDSTKIESDSLKVAPADSLNVSSDSTTIETDSSGVEIEKQIPEGAEVEGVVPPVVPETDVVEHGLKSELHITLGKDGVPPAAERVFTEIALDHMDIGDGFDVADGAKALNISQNLLELSSGHNVAGLDAKAFSEFAKFDPATGKIDITDPAKWNEALGKLETHANELWDNGTLKAEGGAASYVDQMKDDTWLKALHAEHLEKLHDAAGAEVSTGIVGHDDIAADKIADLHKELDALYPDGHDVPHGASTVTANASGNLLDASGKPVSTADMLAMGPGNTVIGGAPYQNLSGADFHQSLAGLSPTQIENLINTHKLPPFETLSGPEQYAVTQIQVRMDLTEYAKDTYKNMPTDTIVEDWVDAAKTTDLSTALNDTDFVTKNGIASLMYHLKFEFGNGDIEQGEGALRDYVTNNSNPNIWDALEESARAKLVQ